MIDKRVDTIDAALSGIEDGSTILVSGFGNAGSPIRLLEALIDQGAANLTIVSNNAGEGEFGLAALMKAGRVTKVICSYPRSAGSIIFEELYDQGKIELEVVPQGTLSERMRAAGAGIGGFFTPTSAGTLLGANKETREIEGKLHVLETPLKGDVALVKADAGDRWGNLTYNKSARNFGPTMAMAAKLTIAEVKTIKELGEISPEHVVTPGIFVDRVIKLREER
ncbi:MAG TPA: 3-oxoacid CoA-transferase subunit A [Rhodospirillales bacterium]|jgi:3-oxoadipate CoA-transferase alpha subunit|nr:MAG: 3-oxoadipate CoA-transferase subunit A [Alphaproteobacteria bacterium MarineAlpha3_Bin6]HHZ76802.1 3-oxoacid CoA-transferase subunit A [Rhodospirillales bacterium]HIB21442.1 3-oxoacid CoA-transferase subunit A [Rhodospirillales bacterium]HIC59913.1 3-oxoacid CoA-transferase subunit A [Rhodospirillales bacterium]HIM19023.1 3-oxoacid CoA-transferase subunit A [Rhodospirillales bacterium]|tara:strand:- start:805 stop:1476 length:672 start_codon:yes stop_codon:yes gene_type:complete